jgi:hypothetical protein
MTSPSLQKNAAWPLDRQLSSVEEIRTPSPRAEAFKCEAQSSRAVGAKDPDQSLTEEEMAAPNGGSPEHTSEEPLSPMTNGSVYTPGSGAAAKSNLGTPSGWQTQKKKKKNRKTVKSENDAQALNAIGGETLPADEALRKGG